MRLRILYLSLCFPIALASTQETSDSAAVSGKQYIGLKFGRDLPKGIKYSGGYLLDDRLSLRQVRSRQRIMIWFDQFLFRDSTGTAHFQVLDVLVLPKIRSGQVLIFGTCLFKGDNRYDPEIIGIGDDNGSPSVRRIRVAWRANRTTQKFESISVDDLEGINESKISD